MKYMRLWRARSYQFPILLLHPMWIILRMRTGLLSILHVNVKCTWVSFMKHNADISQELLVNHCIGIILTWLFSIYFSFFTRKLDILLFGQLVSPSDSFFDDKQAYHGLYNRCTISMVPQCCIVIWDILTLDYHVLS